MRPRSGGGIAAIGRRFRIADDDRNRKLSHEEVVKMFNDLQLGFSQKEMQILFLALDADGSGEIDLDEFIDAVVEHETLFALFWRLLFGAQLRPNVLNLLKNT